MNYIKRFFLMPFGFVKGVLKLSNDYARDFENTQRFPKSIIDAGCCINLNTKIGDKSHILSNSIINNSTIGNYSYCNRNCLIQNASIGDYCSISSEVIIGPGAHPIDHFSTSTLFYKAKNTLNIQLRDKDLDFEEYKHVEIGSDVWIGARAIIMNGVIIGHGAIIGSGAVVTKDVEPYSIVGGVPARLIKMRFDKSLIDDLLISKWWEDDPQKVYEKRYIGK